MDGSATINPAALTGSATSLQPNVHSQANSRGTKRSRSPDPYGVQNPSNSDAKNSKRSKVKSEQTSSSGNNRAATANMSHQPVQTPQLKGSSLPQASPNQASPNRSATKPPVVKALPTVRDHTTDQLNPEGDEYIPREIDPAGEQKVSPDGHPLGGRKYKCRTFEVPNRGRKLFMLATECARVLSYRDSYLLFNKNRSLFKIIASQAEKDNLITQEILPYSYRSRQIAIVTARSMFRQFGSRLIVDGRRVRDDYWEAKAKKQGFTEEDLAGEKRPGMTKMRQEQQEQAASVLTSLPQGEIIYSNSGPAFENQPPTMTQQTSLAPLPMIHMPADELRPSVMGNFNRPRQEPNSPAYQDRIQQSSASEMLAQTANAAEFNKQVKEGRNHRDAFLKNYWNRPHEQPTSEAATSQSDLHTIAPQNLQSPQTVSNMTPSRGGPSDQQQQQQLTHSNAPYAQQTYSGYHNPQNAMASPVQNVHRSAPPPQMHPSSPSMNLGGAANTHRQQAPSYGGYAQNQMWPPAPGQSGLPQPHQMSTYAQQQQQQHQQQHHSQMPPPQLQNPGMGYANTMASMGGYPGMNRAMYQQSPHAQQQQQQQYGMQVPQGQGSGAQQQSMQGWAPPGGAGSMGGGYGFQ